jgi:hypothetical protein
MTKAKAISIVAAVAGLALAAPAITFFSNRSIVDNCNAGVKTYCLEILDARPLLRSRLSEAGEGVILDIEDGRARDGEGLEASHSRTISRAGVLSEDLPFTSQNSHIAYGTPTAQVVVTYRDGSVAHYYLQQHGEGHSSLPGHDRTNNGLNWEYVNGSDVKIIAQTGQVTFLGGQQARVSSSIDRAESLIAQSRKEAAAREAAEQAERQRQEELGARVVETLGSAMLHSIFN